MEKTEEKDPCVICQKPTQYDKKTHVHLRRNYVEGVGQTCDTCAENLRKGGAVV